MSFEWTDKKLDWFQAAVSYTDFYQGIVRKCRHLIDNETTFVDLGCGVGELSISLAPYVKSGLAVDIAHQAVATVEERLDRLEIENIKTLRADWLSYKFNSRYDLVFLSYLDGLTSNLQRLKSLTDKYIVVIMPASRRENPFNLRKFCKLEEKDRETFSDAVEYLDSEEIEYQLIEHRVEFGQPFKSFEGYQEFLKAYFEIDDNHLIDKIAANCLQETDDGFYLPSTKNSVIIVINKKKD